MSPLYILIKDILPYFLDLRINMMYNKLDEKIGLTDEGRWTAW